MNDQAVDGSAGTAHCTYTYIYHNSNASFLIHVIPSPCHLFEQLPTCRKYFVEIEIRKGRKEDRSVQHRINERYKHNQCKSISSRSICFQDSPYLHKTHTPTRTRTYVHTKILVLQYFFIAYLQKARTERSFALQNDAAERKGGSYMIPLLYICSMCFHCAVV